MSNPIPTPRRMATGIGSPTSTTILAMNTAATPEVAATDRSISPVRRTKTSPSAIIPVTVDWISRLLRLRLVRKTSDCVAKKRNSATSPSATGTKRNSLPNLSVRPRFAGAVVFGVIVVSVIGLSALSGHVDGFIAADHDVDHLFAGHVPGIETARVAPQPQHLDPVGVV